MTVSCCTWTRGRAEADVLAGIASAGPRHINHRPFDFRSAESRRLISDLELTPTCMATGFGMPDGAALDTADVDARNVAVMIEKGPAVDHLDEILNIDGIDMIQWGPVDYSESVGKIGRRDAVKGVERVVIEKSPAAGRNPRAGINTADVARYYLDLGVRHFCIGTDVHVLHGYWRREGDDMRKALDGS